MDVANAADVAGAANGEDGPDVADVSPSSDVANAPDVANAADAVDASAVADVADDPVGPDLGMGGSDGARPTCGGDHFGNPWHPVDIIAVLDRSASMQDDADGTTPTGPTDPSRWDQIVPALIDVVRQTEASFDWGLKSFPEDGLACSATSVTANIDVPMATMNADAMAAAIQALTPTGNGTPTGGAIRAAVDSLNASADGNPKFLLLVTDGDASCKGGAGNLTSSDGITADGDTRSAINAALSRLIPTFVMGPNTSRVADQAALDSFAVAGQVPAPVLRPGAPSYYLAGAQSELVSALESTAQLYTSCELQLSHPPPVPGDVTVIVDGIVVPRDILHRQGWDLNGTANGFVDLFGSWCRSVKAGGVSDVQVTFGCPGSADGMCPDRSYRLSTNPPEILIVLDRSGSMSADVNDQPCAGGCGPSSKWALTSAAINQTVQETQSTIQWSLELFPISNLSNRCDVGGQLVVPPGFDHASSIATAIASAQPGGLSPTTQALGTALNYFAANGSPNPRYVLLATDGLPLCGNLNEPNSPDSARAVTMVSLLASENIPTFVIGVGTAAADRDVLTRMAVAGLRPRSGGTAYYAPSDTASLVSALSTITGSAVSCSFTVPGEPADPAHITVRTGFSEIIPRDPVDGWTYSAADQSIVLTGSRCDQMRAGSLTFVDIDIGC